MTSCDRRAVLFLTSNFYIFIQCRHAKLIPDLHLSIAHFTYGVAIWNLALLDTAVFARWGRSLKMLFYTCIHTTGKHTPCKLSFVYTSHVKLIVRTESKFG